MVYKVLLPRIDPAMDSGIIAEWAKKEGEPVKKGERLATVESQKAVFDVEASESGVLRKILYPVGSVVPINEVIAIIGSQDEVIPEAEAVKSQEKAGSPEAERLKVSPVARKLAEEYGIDLAKVRRSGPEGRITREDILNAVKGRGEEKEAPPAAHMRNVEEIIPLTSVRKTIAERMTYSHTNIPTATLMMKVDMSEGKKAVQRDKDTISYTALFVKAVATALKENRIMNSTLEGDEIKILKDVNIGIAVATERGLVVPVVNNAAEKSVQEISQFTRGLVEKAQTGKLSFGEMSGGTFTITNLGTFGVEAFMPLINPKETGILGIGMIEDEPRVTNGQLTIRPTVTLTLTFDHRIVDGAPAARFLSRIKELLESPAALIS